MYWLWDQFQSLIFMTTFVTILITLVQTLLFFLHKVWYIISHNCFFDTNLVLFDTNFSTDPNMSFLTQIIKIDINSIYLDKNISRTYRINVKTSRMDLKTSRMDLKTSRMDLKTSRIKVKTSRMESPRIDVWMESSRIEFLNPFSAFLNPFSTFLHWFYTSENYFCQDILN